MGVDGTRYSSSNTVLTTCERNAGLGGWGEVNREPGAPWVQSYCITYVVSESLLYSLSQENAERESMVASIYICERRFLVAHWPLCYGVNVDTKDVLNGEGNMYSYSAALVGSRAVVICHLHLCR